jgi:hypothetical protein
MDLYASINCYLLYYAPVFFISQGDRSTIYWKMMKKQEVKTTAGENIFPGPTFSGH